MTVSSISFQTSNLQALRAQNAFQRTQKIKEEPIQNIEKDWNELNKYEKCDFRISSTPASQDVKVSITSKEINFEPVRQNKPVEQKNPYINEIKSFAEKYNAADIEEEDIQEALKYGTSLFADYTA